MCPSKWDINAHHEQVAFAYFALVNCVAGHVASRTCDLRDGLSCVVNMGSLRDIWVSLMIWSDEWSGSRSLGRRHDAGGVDSRMSMACVPGCRQHMCPKAPIEVFHTRDQNHVTAGGGPILGVKLCNSCRGSGRYVIETSW